MQRLGIACAPTVALDAGITRAPVLPFPYPVAVKALSAEIAHKSDIGGVHLGARTASDVQRAAQNVLDNARRNCPGATIDGILVQEMVEDGVEAG